MITEKHKQMLEQAVATGDKGKITAAFRTVLGEEMASIGDTSPVANEYIKRIVEQIAAPITTEVTAVADNGEYAQSCRKDSNGICHLFGSFAALLAVGAVSSKFGIIYGGGLAAIVAAVVHFFKRRKDKALKTAAPDTPNLTIMEKTNADGLVAATEKIVNEFKNLVGELKEKPAGNTEAKRLPLHECYPNILTWMQGVYSYSLTFDEETRTFVHSAIKNITLACGYKTVEYDGTNADWFETHEEDELQEPVTTSPTFLYIKTDKIVNVGTLALPKHLK